MLNLYNYRCAYCLKKTRRLTKDHLIPKSKGGECDYRYNIVPACRQCNEEKDNKPIWAMLVKMNG